MAYERWAKRMDDAVLSSWLRGLRSQDRPDTVSAERPFIANRRPKASSLRQLDGRTVASAER